MKLIKLIKRLAQIGAFGAIAFTIGKCGIGSLAAYGMMIIAVQGTCVPFFASGQSLNWQPEARSRRIRSRRRHRLEKQSVGYSSRCFNALACVERPMTVPIGHSWLMGSTTRLSGAIHHAMRASSATWIGRRNHSAHIGIDENRSGRWSM